MSDSFFTGSPGVASGPQAQQERPVHDKTIQAHKPQVGRRVGRQGVEP
jgi:hypothetical protein